MLKVVNHIRLHHVRWFMYAPNADQDWTTVVLKKEVSNNAKAQQQRPNEPKKIGQRHADGTPAWKIEKKVDEGVPLDRVGTDLGRAIVRARLEKKWRQEDLARAVNVPASKINEIERGTALKNGPLLAKIRRVLGINP